jgi:fatty-acyl-CoA synthase
VSDSMTYELDWLKRWQKYSPERIAIKDGETGTQFSYRQLYTWACRGAAVLTDLGLQHGDRIAVLSMNELEYVGLFFAAQRIGAVIVPLNYRLTQREINDIVSDSRPALIVFNKEFSNLLENLPLQSRPREAILLSEFSARTNSAVEKTEYLGKPQDTTMIIYTSGTTGKPKGAMLTHEMIFWNSINTSLRLNLSQEDCTVIFLPFFHTGGWNVLTTPLLHRGGKVIFLKKFDAEKILHLCENERTTILFGVPTTLDMMARSLNFQKTQLQSLRYAIVGGEPMPVHLIEKWHAKGVPIRQGYGLTEFGPNVFSLNESDAVRKIGSIGFPNFYVDVKVIKDDGGECAHGEIGELLLRGPMCMRGYWNNQAATDQTIENGWLKTGDLVKFDSEGFFYVAGRKKDMYKSGGENVYPVEVEKVICSVSGVREVAVVGSKDEKWGEVGTAFIVLEESSNLTEQDLLQHCLSSLAKFKIPKYFKFVAGLPKSDSGKILKRKLSEIDP